MNKKKIFELLGFLAACYGIAVLGSFATQGSLDPWYANLQKASWNPPAWVFGPAWTFLYFLIAVAGWQLFIVKKSELRSRALIFYAIQLFCNGIWSFLFFYFQSPFLGLLDIILLTCFIGLTIQAAWGIARIASVLLIPYFVWTVYALTLNAAIVYLY